MLFDLMAFLAAIGLIGGCLRIIARDSVLADKVRRVRRALGVGA